MNKTICLVLLTLMAIKTISVENQMYKYRAMETKLAHQNLDFKILTDKLSGCQLMYEGCTIVIEKTKPEIKGYAHYWSPK